MMRVRKPLTAETEQASAWDTWTKEPSTFSWYYDEKETCYILEGKVFVTPEGGEAVEIKKGDFVEFPVGMHCTWKIVQNIRKHYKFG
jgi:uncharacterized cupin superfamily protein